MSSAPLVEEAVLGGEEAELTQQGHLQYDDYY
jgi:hypothetical protein